MPDMIAMTNLSTNPADPTAGVSRLQDAQEQRRQEALFRVYQEQHREGGTHTIYCIRVEVKEWTVQERKQL